MMLELTFTPRTAACVVCDWTESWPTVPRAKAASVWHVYQTHTAYWLTVVGDRPPTVKNPRVELN